MKDSILEHSISDKEVERNQIKVIKALRDPSNLQCVGRYRRQSNVLFDKDQHCVAGLIHVTVIGKLDSDTTFNKESEAKIAELLALPSDWLPILITLNDGEPPAAYDDRPNRHTFKEIANFLISHNDFPNVPLTDSSDEVGQ